MPTSRILQAIDALWSRLQSDHPDLPAMRTSVVPTPPPSKHLPERWSWEDDGTATGLVISADVLRRGGDAVLEEVLHEAAHVRCWIRGLTDTSRRGTYHNGVFLEAAEDMGLHWSADVSVSGTVRGYEPRLTDETTRRYAPQVEEIEAAIPIALPHLVVPDYAPRKSQPNRLTLRCGCPEPRRIQTARTTLAKGPITCGVCRKDFAA